MVVGMEEVGSVMCSLASYSNGLPHVNTPPLALFPRAVHVRTIKGSLSIRMLCPYVKHSGSLLVLAEM